MQAQFYKNILIPISYWKSYEKYNRREQRRQNIRMIFHASFYFQQTRL